MKKAIVIFLSMTMLLSAGACSNNKEISESTSTEIMQIAEPIQLVNKMTETERARVNKHTLTLLDEPADIDDIEHKVSIEFATNTIEFDEKEIDEMRVKLENRRDEITDDEYEQAIEEINEIAESGKKSYTYAAYALIDGVLYSGSFWEPESDDYGMSFTIYNDEMNEVETVTFNTFEEYLDWAAKRYKKEGFYSDDMIKSKIRQIQMVRDALKSGDYETLPEGSIDLNDPLLFTDPYADPFADYRNTWEYDRTAVEAIKDSIDEISIYDEELNTEFLVHVTLPSNYDKDKTYPVFFLTDGVWRFGNHTELRKVMEDGEADDVILVSLGYNYKIDGTNAYYRFTHLIQERNKLLDFITDNLMPYLGENYSIDYANSSLYGHSNGGVFAHNALFHSDLYENQPFGNYIIGSPAFWGLYDEEFDLDPDGCQSDYGYFDRNDTLDKNVFLCGGSLEDPDYADSYNGHDTTLEGLAKLNDRLESHNANVTYKLYESHHYQFIPEMLIEFLKETYPKL
ncbi:MAG: hypothetical protein K2J47_11260 [Ruminococcus sp.]|nr:hypothetical protein [Ruminococcus sp.]